MYKKDSNHPNFARLVLIHKVITSSKPSTIDMYGAAYE
jgi:hypothetical protein